MLRFFSLLVILLFATLVSKGQQYNFRNYSVSEGLAQSQVYSICEDKLGYIWAGTRGGGISRFNGLQFLNFTTDDGLPDNYIRSLYKDNEENIWIGTDKGLSVYNGIKFKNYTIINGLYDETVNAAIKDKNGIVWIATKSGIFHLSNDTIVRFGRKLGIPMEQFNCLLEDKNGIVWAGSEKGLYRIDIRSREWNFKIYDRKNGLSANSIQDVKEGFSGELWISTYGGGVMVMKNNTFKKYTVKNGLPGNTIYTCLPTSEDIVWFGTSHGVSKLYIKSGRIKNYTQTEGLTNNVVTALFKDSFGNNWFGTSGGGISKLGQERFIHFPKINKLMGSWVYTILQDKAEAMWFGTSEGGVTRYDGKYYKRFSQRNGFTAHKVRAGYQDKEGNLWFGTTSDGAYLYNGKTFKHFDTRNGLSSNFINYIISDTSGSIWMATAGGGISRLIKKNNGKYKIVKITPLRGLCSNRINALLCDKKGRIWAASAGQGVSKIILTGPENYKITNFSKKNGLKGEHIRCIESDKNGNIYFGSSDAGILVYNGKNFYTINRDKGISSNNIYSLIFDNSGNLWVGTEKGIDRLTFNHGNISEVKHYGQSEGFKGIETIQNSVCIDKEGHIWFGSVKCATCYLSENDNKLRVPQVHLSGINLFFDPIQQTSFAGKTSSWSFVPDSLTLPHNKNHLSFQFTAIEHSNPEAVKYSWKLAGFDKEFSPASQKNEAVYSNLPPGTYNLIVKAANENNNWNQATLCSFTITPPFWETWWFRLLMLSALVSISTVTYKIRKRSLQKENRIERQRLEMERRLIDIEQKALRLQMNPHFLFNCLNSIKGLIAEEKSSEAKIYLSKFSKLMRAMLENSRAGFISLDDEFNYLQNYVELEKLSLSTNLEFEINADLDMDQKMIEIPPMLLQPFIENSIVHGISPKKGAGKITLSVKRTGDYLYCIIEDNGIGPEASRSKNQHLCQTHNSSAIEVTRERLKILHKKYYFPYSDLKITDLKNELSDLTGTRVELKIPFRKL